MHKKFLAALLTGCTLATGCIDLEVAAVQPAAGTAFTREEVLADPSLMEMVVAGVFINFWGGAQYAQPWTVFSIYGEELTSSAIDVANFNRAASQRTQIWEHVQEPRPSFNNSLTGTSLLARDPWANFYEANAAATDMPRIMRERNIRIIDRLTGVDNTDRLLAFSTWIQGMSHVYLGLIFDSAAIITTEVDLAKIPILPFKPYQEVLDSGVKWLEDAIAIAEEVTFLLPLKNDLWVYNTAFTNTQMAAVAHSYIARALVYGARTPAERQAVDWTKVKFHLDRGVTSAFGPMGLPNPLISMDYRGSVTSPPQNTTAICNGFCNHAGEFRVDLRLVGPADTSGKYQTWLASASGPDAQNTQPFIVETPDARIQASTATVPAQKPTYFKFTTLDPPATVFDTVNRGRLYVSNYWSSSRALNNHTQLPRDGGGRNRRNNADLGAIQDALLLPAEVNLLKAEAEYRLNNFQAAADLINITRVENGELPPVTAAGVPVSNACVPQRYDGSCGDLWDALMYEKRIETFGTAISYFDLRGWGCLLEGTPIQLPPPGRQLDLQDKVIHTYGGVGLLGGAPKPTNCPLLHRP